VYAVSNTGMCVWVCVGVCGGVWGVCMCVCVCVCVWGMCVCVCEKGGSGWNQIFNANLKLFLRLSNCESVNEKKTLIIIKMHGSMYVKIRV
jgi:hypothetical protein